MKRRDGLARFRAVEGEIRAGLVAGKTLLAIWEEHEQHLAMSYSQFARYVQRMKAGSEMRQRASTPARGPATRMKEVNSKRSSRDGPGEPPQRLNLDDLAARALRDDDLF